MSYQTHGLSTMGPAAYGDGNGDFNMDISLPMDLDIDLTGGADQTFGGGITPQHTSNGHSISNAPTLSAHPQAQQQQLHQQQETSLTGAGAGPLPTGFGMSTPSNSSTLTEFTKRRNWSQRIIEELKDFLHILTPDGRILYVSPSCKVITGHDPHTLIGKFIGEYVHPDDSGIFMREFNESIASGNGLRFFYRFKKDDGTFMIFECDGHPHISPEPPGSQSYGQTPAGKSLAVAGLCRGFFMMARPYPTRNAALLDSFLEHKIENERLMKRIEELKREELEENAEQDKLLREQGSQTGVTQSESRTSKAPGDATSEAQVTAAPTPNYQGMPPPAKPTISNTALTRQNLDSALQAQRPDSIADKMSRYEANNTHLESIELLTGLRYRDGERSHGISTGDTSPALIRGDAGIAILLDRDREGAKKEKKKLKVADEYVCADCGTLDSPEWRKGPKGPKTLCNACGLRWAKKEKKRSGVDDGNTSSPGGGSMSMHASTPLGSQMGLTSMGNPPGMPMHNSNESGGSSM
nr:TPA_inf: white collar-2 [Zymoseptoria tritici IPO323]